MLRFYIGVDVSKKSLSVALVDAQDKILWKNKSISNNVSGFKTIISKVLQSASRESSDQTFEIAAGLENTGVYGEKLCHFLYENGNGRFTVYVLAPKPVRSFAEISKEYNKNDDTDAKLIASYLCVAIMKNKLTPWTPPEPRDEHLKFLCRRREELLHLRTQESNRLEKVLNMGTNYPDLEQSVRNHLKYLEDEIRSIEEKIKEDINHSSTCKEDDKLLQSITGVGRVLSSTFLAEIGDIKRYKSAKQIVAFVGLAPREYTSGTSVHKRSKISKRGRGRIRGCLFMAVMVATRFNPVIREFYKRLLERGKSKMLSLHACMRKLLHIMYGVLKSRSTFVATA